jgi:hypothetical protein
MAARLLALVLALALLAPVPGVAQRLDEVGEDCTSQLSPLPSGASASLRGRALEHLAPDRCHELLRARAIVFDALPAASGVADPVRLRGSLAGIAIRTRGEAPRARRGRTPEDHRFDAVFDCRLVLVLATWAPRVRAAGFVAIEHVSVHRPHARVAATGRVSGHAHALAIDVLRLVRADGSSFSILDDWTARERGGDPCAAHDEPAEQASVRALVCRAASEGLFQVVITPHHDDRHANHVHLEIRPDVDWQIVR